MARNPAEPARVVADGPLLPAPPVTGLVNPIAGRGNGEARWREVAAALPDARTVLTRDRDHARAVAEEEAAAGRVVVAVGGDGLVRDVAGGVVAARGEMAVLPAGRGNDLAAALGLPSAGPDLVALLRRGASRPVDVIDVGGAVVPGNVYCGIDVVAGDLIERARWMRPWLAYRLAPLLAVATWRAPTFRLSLDGRVRSVRAHTVVVANTGRYGHGLAIVPPARADDGFLDVLVVGNLPRWAILPFLVRARSGRHLDRPQVSVIRASEVTVAADRALAVGGDGERIATLPVTIRLRPGALRLFRP